MALSIEQQILVEQRLNNERKSIGVAYLLWIFLGGFAAHRFYLGKTGSAVAMLLLSLVGWLTLFVYVGGLFLAILGIWLIVDAFLIPGMVRADAEQKRLVLSSQVGLA